ncbi:S8 family peptidase [Flavobacterium sp. DG1-102-2]|uniref:S8 family peptidase n=1 Tax=Flavobacterium sp. DG1-102-2 TaxID=3081663 RepID=UPI00294A27C9|nr:S8 family peptidase [Flavobacterium sp. DG1-102-2]MDV6169887.1 S8 family peptidase [Flavobacterium sp. DG1-102-2]
MKNKITILLLSLFAGLSYGQSRKGQLHLTPESKSHRLYVSFMPETENNNEKSGFSSSPQLEQLAKEYHITALKAVDIPAAKLEELKSAAIKNAGSSAAVDKLANIYELTIDNPSNERMLELAQSLEKFDAVEYCSLMPLSPVKPPYDIFPATPSFIDQQNYVSDYGVDMAYAWELGLTGQNINIRDIEFGFNKDHEELNDRNVYVGADMVVSSLATQDFTEHGTGVLGIMYADKEGDYGVSGLAYGANELALFTEYEQTTGYNRVNAIIKCISNSVEGDFIIYELQATGALGQYGPAEYENVVWDLTKAATDGGMIVVAAAGNGAENLDAPAYNSYNNRGDSGAIIVGAGSNDENHDRLDFSTYGARVDLQGWGTGVLTSGSGTAYTIAGDFNQAYAWFNGTSSATPIVASCAIVLQSHYHSVTNDYISGPELRELLKATGKPQGEGENIGPLPNMPAALAAMDEMLGINSVEKESFIAYPNPVSDRLKIAGNFSDKVSVKIYNAVGQLVSSQANADNEIDFSSFSKGIYIVKVSDNGKTVSKKIVKN